MPREHAVGAFHAWDGGCLFIGRDGGLVPVHAHHALQIVFGSSGEIGLRASDREPWHRMAGGIVPSLAPHSLDASTVPQNVVLFLEPETREGRAMVERYVRGGITMLPMAEFSGAASALFDAWRHDGREEAVVAAAWRLIHEMTHGVEPTVVMDERIRRAVAFIKGHLDAPLTLERVAAEASLSPSRFRHLFVEQTGMALRPYILWRRFLRVWSLLMDGASLSEAAHEAGFADAAHLSRTSRRMFGLAPSALQMRMGRGEPSDG